MFAKMFKQKDYRYYLLQVVLFFALLITLDYITGLALHYFYKKQKSGWDYRTRYSIEETKADVLIFGASRAQQQYNPVFFEDTLQLTSYNVGRDGMPIFYHYAVLQAVLNRHTPKVIILDCEYAALKKAESSYERISCLLPFYKNHPEMRSVIELRSPFEKYKLLSQTYPYNSLLFKVAVGNVSKKQEDIKGYVPLFHSLTDSIKTYDYTAPYELDSVKVNMLRAFIDDCQKKNITILFTCAPYYMNITGEDYSLATTKKIALEKNVRFLDYSKEEVFRSNPALFDDTVHVNNNGSKIFSAMVASDVKKIITAH